MCVVPVCEFKDKIEVKSVCDFCVLGERVSGGLRAARPASGTSNRSHAHGVVTVVCQNNDSLGRVGNLKRIGVRHARS